MKLPKASVRAVLRYDAGAAECAGCAASGAVVPAATATADDEADMASEQDGVTTQSMNCHTAATSVISSNTVAIAWASR